MPSEKENPILICTSEQIRIAVGNALRSSLGLQLGMHFGAFGDVWRVHALSSNVPGRPLGAGLAGCPLPRMVFFIRPGVGWLPLGRDRVMGREGREREG